MPQGLDPNTLQSLMTAMQIHPQLQNALQRLDLRRVLSSAMDRAICDIIQPVIERSASIACMTAHELVNKDFALDPDVERMRKAAHLMVSGLAASLALVTGKEPLRVSMSNQLRALLGANVPDQVNRGGPGSVT